MWPFKKNKQEFICIRAYHSVTGEWEFFYHEASEQYTVEIVRDFLNEIIDSMTETTVNRRNVIFSYGDNLIRVEDYSSFVVYREWL